MPFYSDNPVADYDRYDAYLARQEARLPVCDDCDKPIHGDDYYEIDGEILCEECMKDRYRRSVADWLDAHE